MTQDKLTKVRDWCDECGGEGEVSSCCDSEIDGNRCLRCGKFTSPRVCYHCDGYGHTEYNIGDEVEIFICVYSDEDLKKQLYKPKQLGDNKTFEGKIIEFVDQWNAIVKVGRKKINVKIEDISIR